MAKKTRTGPNKSQLIRDYMKEHPSENPREVAAKLSAEHGIEIKPGFVSSIKFNDNKKSGKPAGSGKRGRPPGKGKVKAAAAGATSTLSEGGITGADIREAKKFLDKIGNAAKAREALSIIAEILGS